MGHFKILEVAILMVLGSWASRVAMSHTLHVVEEANSMVELYERWIKQHGRTHVDAAEKELRSHIFKQNVGFVENFNSNNEGNRTFKLGLNPFSDMTLEEFLQHFTGFKLPDHYLRSSAPTSTSFRHQNVTDIPMSLDWRERGAVNPIKYQGQCGCCWAFSAVAAVEGITQIKTGKLVSLSEQQLVDCDAENSGCEGGMMDRAFEYIVNNNGISSEDNYAYEEAQETCDAQKSSDQIGAQISGFESVPANSELDLLKAVSVQPVSVAIAIGEEFKAYDGGVFSGDCGPQINHAVTLIGFGETEDGTRYWLAKNSWGETWGENGFVRIQRQTGGDPQGVCSIASLASYPTHD